MRKRFLVTLLAGAALIVPQAAVGGGASQGFRLPPIPYAETIPWLAANNNTLRPPAYLGLLLAPVPMATPPAQFAAAPQPLGGMLSGTTRHLGRLATKTVRS